MRALVVFVLCVFAAWAIFINVDWRRISLYCQFAVLACLYYRAVKWWGQEVRRFPEYSEDDSR